MRTSRGYSILLSFLDWVGMKPLSERDENSWGTISYQDYSVIGRNEATLWKRWEPIPKRSKHPWIRLVGMKPLSERDENIRYLSFCFTTSLIVGMKPLSERDENLANCVAIVRTTAFVGMKPLSERDENSIDSKALTNSLDVVGMKPLSERDENFSVFAYKCYCETCL